MEAAAALASTATEVGFVTIQPGLMCVIKRVSALKLF
jgi:hypothetical protein